MSLTHSDNKTAAPSIEGQPAVSQGNDKKVPHEHARGCCCHHHEADHAEKS